MPNAGTSPLVCVFCGADWLHIYRQCPHCGGKYVTRREDWIPRQLTLDTWSWPDA